MSKRAIAALLVVIAIISIPFALRSTKERRSRFGSSPNQVAVAYLTGAIQADSALSTDGTDNIADLINFLADVRDESNVRAVVLRVESPGGSAAMAQELHQAIMKVRDAGKPVVVSMGNMAASAAYYVATAADRIVANPSTLTGSIGAVSRFLNFAGLAEEYGFSYETVVTGPYKDLGNPTRPMTDDERAVLMELMNDSLDEFVRVIVEGRGLGEEEVRRLADGRLYTGRQAMELGLVDDLGGLEDSIRLAANLAGIEGEPRVVRHTRRVPLLQRYLGFIARNQHSSSLITFERIKEAVEGPDLSLWY